MPAPHLPQGSEGACLPACARMVLAAMGDFRTEDELARILNSYDFGTPARNITRLSSLGYRVTYESTTLDAMRAELDAGHFVIAFVRADFLPWSDFDGFHAIVVLEVTDSEVVVNDPAQVEGALHLSTDGFLIAWAEFDQTAAFISDRE